MLGVRREQGQALLSSSPPSRREGLRGKNGPPPIASHPKAQCFQDPKLEPQKLNVSFGPLKCFNFVVINPHQRIFSPIDF